MLNFSPVLQLRQASQSATSADTDVVRQSVKVPVCSVVTAPGCASKLRKQIKEPQTQTKTHLQCDREIRGTRKLHRLNLPLERSVSLVGCRDFHNEHLNKRGKKGCFSTARVCTWLPQEIQRYIRDAVVISALWLGRFLPAASVQVEKRQRSASTIAPVIACHPVQSWKPHTSDSK